jgi:hypothetical protein
MCGWNGSKFASRVRSVSLVSVASASAPIPIGVGRDRRSDLVKAARLRRDRIRPRAPAQCRLRRPAPASLFHECVGCGIRLGMQFAFAVAGSLENAPLRVDP